MLLNDLIVDSSGRYFGDNAVMLCFYLCWLFEEVEGEKQKSMVQPV